MTGATTTALAIGTTAESRTFGPLTTRMFVRYAGASGDLNPMHYDDNLARSAGNPSVFSQGMHQSALLATFATDWLGATNIRRFAVRFSEKVWPGDVVTCAGEVTNVEPIPDGGLQVTVMLSCTRQSGGVAITGSADFRLPPSS